MRTVILIPARFGSSRYPGKPLVPLLGKPMVLWVAEQSAQVVGIDNVYVATEDHRIAEVVRQAGFQAVMTSDDALTGTDRIAEAAENIDADFYINVQGDEPLVDPADIENIIQAKVETPNEVINGYSWVSEAEDPHSVNIPKVITNENNRLVYMSRLPLPGYKDNMHAPKFYKKQVCIYAFTREELADFRAVGRKSELEQCEDIEILRFLELDKQIRLVETKPGSLAVDVPEDVANVERVMRKARSHG